MSARAATFKICKVEVESTLSETATVEWLRRFNNGETSLEDQSRSSRQSTMNLETLLMVVEQQQQTTLSRLSAELSSSMFPIARRYFNKIGLKNRRSRQ